MSNRIDMPLRPSLAAGFIAAAPWLTLALAAAMLALGGSLLLWSFCVVGILGASWQLRASGLLKATNSVTQLSVAEGRLYAHFADGRRLAAQAASESRLFGQLVLLKLQVEKNARRKPALVVAFTSGKLGAGSGNVQPDDFRRLRVWLKLGAAGSLPLHLQQP